MVSLSEPCGSESNGRMAIASSREQAWSRLLAVDGKMSRYPRKGDSLDDRFRRTFLAASGSLAAASLSAQHGVVVAGGGAAQAERQLPRSAVSARRCFGRSVAGWLCDLDPAGTRPNKKGAEMPAEAVEVAWQVGEDEAMNRVVAKGTTAANPQLGHSVHVEVDGIEARSVVLVSVPGGDAIPARSAASRTMPPADSCRSGCEFAFASCQHYESGLVHGLRAHGQGRSRPGRAPGRLHLRTGGERQALRKHAAPKSKTLDDYRNRHAQYKTDPALQAAHAALPVARHLGRSRGGKQLRRRRLGEGADPRRVPEAAGRGEPGLLRADAAPPRFVAPWTADAALSADRLRPAGPVPGARHAAVPHRSAVRRRHQAALRRARSIPRRHCWATSKRRGC